MPLLRRYSLLGVEVKFCKGRQIASTEVVTGYKTVFDSCFILVQKWLLFLLCQWWVHRYSHGYQISEPVAHQDS